MRFSISFVSRGAWTAKRVALLIGFVLTVLGTLGSHVLVDGVQDRSAALDEQAKDAAAQIDVLKNAQSQFLVFEQQGALIYALSAAGLSTGDPEERATLDRLYQLALLDRSIPVREMIGQLALAKTLDYAQTRTKYAALIDAARKNIALADYVALDEFETSVMNGASGLMTQFQARFQALGQEKSDVDRDVDRRKAVLLALMTLGSAFLLAANLVSTGPEREKPAPIAATAPGGEPPTAAQLIELAINHAKSLSAQPPEPR